MWGRICEEEAYKISDKSVVGKLKGSKVESVLGTLNEAEKTLISSASDMLFIPTWFRLVCFFSLLYFRVCASVFNILFNY